jgi:hypothetical protein
MIHPETLKHSLTLTEREEKIILIKYIIHGVSPFFNSPLETRIKMLQTAAEICGYPYDDAEWQEIGRSILATQQKVNEKLSGFVNKNSDEYKTVMRNIKDGNDEIISVVDPYIRDGLKKMGFGK